MLAYHNDPAVKEKYLTRIRAHAKADNLIQGTGWENGRGCGIGCTIEAYEHKRYESEMGIPEHLAHLEDAIFEGLPKAEAMLWPERFLDAIRPGADLSLVFPQFIVWLLIDPVDGVVRFAVKADDKQGEAAIRQVAALYEQRIKGSEPGDASWAAAGDASWAAARAAAWAAAGAAAWAAARAAARAAAWDAAGAASWDAAGDAARAAAGAAAYRRQTDKIIELLRAAKP